MDVNHFQKLKCYFMQ